MSKNIPFEKSFASSDKVKYWSDKNENSPRKTFKSSGKKYRFNCECGHEFESTLNSINRGNWCPYCSNQKLCDLNSCDECFKKSFASSDKVKYWSDKNENSPRKTFKSSGKKYRFNCECGHEFESTLNSINRGNWCPYCSNQKLCDLTSCVQCFEKSFASSDNVKYWSDKNENSPRDIFKSSHTKYWFKCECGHEFESTLNSINRGNWCPYCSNKKLCDSSECINCFEKSFASSDKAKYWSSKNLFNPRTVFKSSSKKYWFNCECGHDFEPALSNISDLGWCPYCSNPPKKLCESNECSVCFEKSFASNDKAKYWSDKNENSPRDIFKSSNTKYWFKCECGHDFDATLNKIILGRWCPYCSNPPKKLCDLNECTNCFEKSFASSDKVKYWSDKNLFNPRNVFKVTGKKYWFNCQCGHVFECGLDCVKIGNWCPYCSNQKLCELTTCHQCFKKSFASSDKVKYWSDKNENSPRDVFKSSHKKYWFKCKKDHQFNSTLKSITTGTWCPYCVHKTEEKLNDKLIKLYPTVQRQFKVDWCKNKNYLPFDFVIPEHKIIIELDGPQHFIQISNWSSPEQNKANDKYKTECANKNNYSVIRLTQADVFYDTYNWLDELDQNIKKIILQKIVQNIYMCKNDEYNHLI